MLVSKLVKNSDKSGEKNPIGHNNLSVLVIDDQVNDEETVFTWNGLCKKFFPLSFLAQKTFVLHVLWLLVPLIIDFTIILFTLFTWAIYFFH